MNPVFLLSCYPPRKSGAMALLTDENCAVLQSRGRRETVPVSQAGLAAKKPEQR